MKKILFALAAVAAFAVAGCTSEAGEQDVRVISYNIRYMNTKDGDNNWEFRKQASINMVNEEQPTVFGLQEAVKAQVDFLAENLPNYAHYGVGRDDGKEKGEFMAIFYDTEEVELLDKGTFWLSATPNTPSKSWNDEIFAPVEGTPGAMKYHRTCTWVKFKHKADGKVFYYYNTHLEFGYHANYNLGQTAREKGVALIVERIKQQAVNGEAVIFGGDMNQVANDKCFNPLFNNGWVSGRATATEVISEANQYSITFNNYEATVREQQENNKGKIIAICVAAALALASISAAVIVILKFK
mgnify:CR=1 FL=1